MYLLDNMIKPKPFLAVYVDIHESYWKGHLQKTNTQNHDAN